MEERVLPSRFPVGPAVIISNLTEEQFLDYIRKGYIDYEVSDGEVYFTESDFIDFFCHNWSEEETPESLTELPEFVELESTYHEIEEQARREINSDEIEGIIINEIDGNEVRRCKICGHADIHSKGLCQKHYNKVNYQYDEVSDETISEFRQESEITSGWSRNYNACRNCGQTDSPHHANGYCNRCYHRDYHHDE